jgi:hypothetical protein
MAWPDGSWLFSKLFSDETIRLTVCLTNKSVLPIVTLTHILT